MLATPSDIKGPLRAIAAAALLTALPGHATAAAYPDKPVILVVPYGSGGGVDIVARAMAAGLSRQLKQSVIVQNRPGAGGTIGAAYVARANPDGYTVLVADVSALAISPTLYANPGYKTNQTFAPISQIATSALDVAVHPALPVRDIKELIAYARAHPGKLSYASPGNGTIPHLASVLFETMTGTSMMHVPYKSGAEAVTALLGGQVQLSFAQVPLTVGLAANGRVRVLGVSSKQPSSLLPGVPPVAQAGVPGYEVTSWVAAMVPAGTPPAVQDVLYRATLAALKDNETRSALTGAGFDIVGNSPSALRAVIDSETDKWAKVIHGAGIAAQ
jgi:tripartite-type tricarboxylate transporter receptor subunit TctC